MRWVGLKRVVLGKCFFEMGGVRFEFSRKFLLDIFIYFYWKCIIIKGLLLFSLSFKNSIIFS